MWLTVAAAAAAACSRGSSPVGGLLFEPGQVRLTYPGSAAAKLSWTPTRDLDRRHGEAVVFVHVLDRAGGRSKVLRTFDHPLPAPWIPGRPQSYELDLYQSALSDPLPPGRYDLAVGLYDDSWGYRWPLDTHGAEAERREYRVGALDVTGPDPSAPRFVFDGPWRPLEAVSTKQVQARRCLAGPARLAVEGIHAAGTVRLQWSISEAPGSALMVTTTCGAGATERPTKRRPWIGVSVAADAPGGRCEISCEPSPPKSPTGEPTACLEVLAWRGSGS